MSLHQAPLNAMSRRQQWLQHSWSLAPHVLHASCICLRCVWRRVHSRFWNALGTPSAAHHIGTAMDSVFGGYNSNDEDEQRDRSSDEESDDSTQMPNDTFHHNMMQSLYPTAFPSGPPPQNIPPSASQAPLPTLASVSAGQRPAWNRLKQQYAATFPNVHRFYDANSRSVAHIAWSFTTPEEVWAIINSNLLYSGKKESMAWYKIHACKMLHEVLSNSKDPQVHALQSTLILMHSL